MMCPLFFFKRLLFSYRITIKIIPYFNFSHIVGKNQPLYHAIWLRLHGNMAEMTK